MARGRAARGAPFVQAELLRAAHTARLAGLLRGEAAALRVVRGLRGARARHDTHRLAGLVTALHELLLTTARLAAADGDPTLVGTARQKYRPGGSLRVLGVFREPVISATGYGGVVTHLLGDDGRWFSVADVRPGGPARARAAGNATVAIGAATLDHARLARGGLLVTGATVSPDGRLGSGRGVRATPLPGATWTSEPLAHLFARPLADVVAERLAGAAPASAESGDALDPAGDPVGCDLVVVGAAGDHLLARELPRPATGPGGDAAARPDAGDDPAAEPTGPLIRLVPANSHPDLAHTDNLRRLASRPGLRLRVIGRLATDRAATLRPLAVGPVPGDETCTLRLPDAWLGRADLGYDRLQGTHLPPEDACPRPPDAHVGPDPLADSPLWRTRRLVELAVAGGRRAVAESGRGGDRTGAALRGAGMPGAAELCAALTAEADRRGRDAFGRLADPDPDSYARAWLATAVHLAATERVLVESSWRQREAPGAMLS
ncbi:hypothetical protein [Wenjunlia vitaminophila]|uniref:hypothetical protein n=1 Tax=Wenjunlia vitaminophila TaxID=76728 RepID=UPI000AFF4F1F|nr:hypothetical protein [Wenjunlia vitaminophila]